MNNTLSKNFKIKIQQASGDAPDGIYSYEFDCGNVDGGNNLCRASVRLTEGGTPSKNSADIMIYGLSKDKLQQLTFLNFNPVKGVDSRNIVEVLVDDVMCFSGNIFFSSSNFDGIPDICLNIVGAIGIYEGSLAQQDLEIRAVQNQTITSIFENFANKMGYGFMNNGVEGNCPDIILNGSLREQILELAKALNINISMDCKMLRIAPMGKPLLKDLPVEVNDKNGLIGYPSFNSNGVNFKAQFNPKIRVGSTVKLTSIVPNSSGEWVVNQKVSTLSSLPNGKWETDYICYVGVGNG